MSLICAARSSAAAFSPAIRAWSSARSTARPRRGAASSSPSANGRRLTGGGPGGGGALERPSCFLSRAPPSIRAMTRLRLSFACCRYDRMEAIREGLVRPEGVELTCITLKSGRDVFDRMVGGREFDVAELSASEFISLAGQGDRRFVALPVFPSRVFRHGYVFINTRASIRTAKDLEGKRVGLPLYTQTAALWVRGHLAHEFGVDLSTIRWVQGSVEDTGTHGKPHAPALLRPITLEQNTTGLSLATLLARGDIDALIGSRKPEILGRDPSVVRLFPNYRALERALYEKRK